MIFVNIRKAVSDFLNENGLFLNDLLEIMDSESTSIRESLSARVIVEEKEISQIERSLTSSHINYLIFVVQTFYLINPGGLYKGDLLIPSREAIICGSKATFTGLIILAKSLGLPNIC